MDSTTAPADTFRPSMLVPHANIHPSALNPRTLFDEAGLEDLAASMGNGVGILEPLIVRAHPKQTLGFEIIAGERRWRAAKMAGIKDVPVICRDMSDARVLDAQLIENDQRADIHPLDRARGLQKRLSLTAGLKPKDLAKSLGLAERTLQNTLRYLTLTPAAQQSFMKGEFSSGHADLLIRLPAADQPAALKGLYGTRYNPDRQKHEPELRSVRDFDEWLKLNIRLNPLEAVQTGLFPELDDVAGPDKNATAVSTLVEIIDRHYFSGGKKGEKAPLTTEQWRPVKKGAASATDTAACDYQQRGVLVYGHGQGRVLTICVGRGKCKKHWADTIAAPAPPRSTTASGKKAKPAKKSAGEVRAAKEAAQRNADAALWQKVEKPACALLTAAAKKIVKPTPALLEFVAQLGKPKTFGELLVQEIDNQVYSLAEARHAAKLLGVDLSPVLKAAAPKPAPVKKPASKKTAKQKPARAFLQKGTRAGVVKALAAKKKPATKKGGKKR